MVSRRYAVVPALALSAQAFLVPPSTSGAVSDLSTGFHITLFEPSSQLVKLDCPNCPFAQPGKDGNLQWVDGMSNALVRIRALRKHYYARSANLA